MAPMPGRYVQPYHTSFSWAKTPKYLTTIESGHFLSLSKDRRWGQVSAGALPPGQEMCVAAQRERGRVMTERAAELEQIGPLLRWIEAKMRRNVSQPRVRLTLGRSASSRVGAGIRVSRDRT
jgi:hypothetical protein